MSTHADTALFDLIYMFSSIILFVQSPYFPPPHIRRFHVPCRMLIGRSQTHLHVCPNLHIPEAQARLNITRVYSRHRILICLISYSYTHTPMFYESYLHNLTTLRDREQSRQATLFRPFAQLTSLQTRLCS